MRRDLVSRAAIVDWTAEKDRGSGAGAVALAAAHPRLDCLAGKCPWRLLRYEAVDSGRVIASTVGREAIREMSRRVSSVISEPDQQDNHRGHGQVVDLL